MRKDFGITTEGTFLKGGVIWTEQGIEYEADMRHVEIMVAVMGL